MADELVPLVVQEIAATDETVDREAMRARYPDSTDAAFGLAFHAALERLRDEHGIVMVPERGGGGRYVRASKEQAARRADNYPRKAKKALARGVATLTAVLQRGDLSPAERVAIEARRNKVADLSTDVATKQRQRARRLVAPANGTEQPAPQAPPKESP